MYSMLALLPCQQLLTRFARAILYREKRMELCRTYAPSNEVENTLDLCLVHLQRHLRHLHLRRLECVPGVTGGFFGSAGCVWV